MLFSSKKTERLIITLLLIIGVLLRGWQYIMGRSLWEDECHLALNFIKYDFIRLLEPLDHIQVAPILFVYLVKAWITVFGISEMSFRAVPFIASLAGLFLFYPAIQSVVKNRVISILSLFLFATNVVLVYFSAELKQYTLDVTVYITLLFLFASENLFVKKNRNLLLATFGSIAVLVSSVSVIVLFTIGLLMITDAVRGRRVERQLFLTIGSWIIVFIVNYLLFIHNHPSWIDQKINYAFAFSPFNIFSPEFDAFIKKTVEETFFTMLLYMDPVSWFRYFLLVVFTCGIYYMISSNRRLLVLTCAPAILHLVLSAFHLYPFWYRLILYLLPAFFIIFSSGLFVIGNLLFRKLHPVAGMLVCAILLYGATHRSFREFPLWPSEISHAIRFLNDSLPHNQHVYITDPINSFTYYHIRGKIKSQHFSGINWYLEPSEFYEITAGEKQGYILFYASKYQWGYGEVVKDLHNRRLIEKNFESHGYTVSQVKPLQVPDGDVVTVLDHRAFDSAIVLSDTKQIAFWGNAPATTKTIVLPAGSYYVSVLSSGTKAGGLFPHINLAWDGRNIGSFYTTRTNSRAGFELHLQHQVSGAFTVAMDNDFAADGEDRNFFLREIRIVKIDDR